LCGWFLPDKMTGNHTDKTFKLRSITIMPITTSAILVARKMTLELNKKRQAEAKRKKNQLKKKRLSRKATEKENGESSNLTRSKNSRSLSG